LMENAAARRPIAEAARHLVASRFSWEAVAREFERLLDS
jgi:hypothetical protein